MRIRALILGLLASALALASPAVAQEYVPKRARAKVDKVDVSEAPLIRIHATFLNSRTVPISPDKVKQAYVACNDTEVGSTADIKTYGDIGEPMDIAIVMPMSNRFSEDVREQMKEGVGAIIGMARDGDRVAAFVDNGVGIQMSGLGAPDEAAGYIGNAEPDGSGAFTYSGIEHAIDTMVAESDDDRRQAIIIITDGFDTDPDYLRPDTVRAKIMELYGRARDEGILVFVVMYKPIIRDLIPYYEGMSRKTRATYRETSTADGILSGVKYAFGEIYGQLVIDFVWDEVEVGKTCAFSVALEREFGKTIVTQPFHDVEIEEVAYDFIGLGIIIAIVVVSLILLLIIFLIVRKIVRKRRAKKAEAEDGKLQEQIDAGTLCGTCHRTMMPDWTECLFCAQEKAQGGGAAKGKAKAAKGKEKAAGKGKAAAKEKAAGKGAAKAGGAGAKKVAPKKAAPAAAKSCDNCGRTFMPGWTECMFCAAGIGSGGGAPTAGGAAGMGAVAAGGGVMAATGGGGGGGGAAKAAAGPRICPTCKREWKDHWEECLYCAAGV